MKAGCRLPEDGGLSPVTNERILIVKRKRSQRIMVLIIAIVVIAAMVLPMIYYVVNV